MLKAVDSVVNFHRNRIGGHLAAIVVWSLNNVKNVKSLPVSNLATTAVITGLLLLSVTTFQTQAAGGLSGQKESILDDASNVITGYYANSKIAELKELRKQLVAAITTAEADGIATTTTEWYSYYSALIHYRLGLLVHEDGERHFRRCLAVNRDITAINGDFIEAYPLFAACSNALITYVPEETMALSAQSTTALKAANALDKKNPRLLLVQGSSALFIPPQYGGGLERSKTLIEQAITQFNKAGVLSPQTPQWGLDEAYMWLGLIHSVNGETALALEAIKQSLLVTNNHWVRDVLLPAAEKGQSLGTYFGIK